MSPTLSGNTQPRFSTGFEASIYVERHETCELQKIVWTTTTRGETTHDEYQRGFENPAATGRPSGVGIKSVQIFGALQIYEFGALHFWDVGHRATWNSKHRGG